MLEKQVSEWLTFYLGHFIRGLDRRQLQISLWAGDVTLRDLQLRPDILEQLSLHLFNQGSGQPGVSPTDAPRDTCRAGIKKPAEKDTSGGARRSSVHAAVLLLPCTVIEGSIEELVLHIPWSAIDREPVRITVRGVRLVIGPLRRRQCDLNEEVARQAAMRDMALRRLNDALFTLLKKEMAVGGEDGAGECGPGVPAGSYGGQSIQPAAQYRGLPTPAPPTPSSSVRREMAEETSRGTSVVEKLMQRMTRNVQLVAQDMTLRYVFDYDDLHPTLTAAATLSINRLEVTTEDTQHRPCFVTEVSQPLCRALRLYDLKLVVHARRSDSETVGAACRVCEAMMGGWRCEQTLLQLPGAQVHVQNTPDTPSLVTVAITDAVQIGLSFGAVRTVYSLVQSLLRYGSAGARYRPFLHLLQQEECDATTPANLARRRWRFAVACVCADLSSSSLWSACCHQDVAPLSAVERAMRFCAVRRAYCQLWKRQCGVAWLPPLQPSEQEELAALERECTLVQVGFLRCMAGAELRSERAAYETQQRLIREARGRRGGQSGSVSRGARLWSWLRRSATSTCEGEAEGDAMPHRPMSEGGGDDLRCSATKVPNTSFTDTFNAGWSYLSVASPHTFNCFTSFFASGATSSDTAPPLLRIECHAVRCVIQPYEWATGRDFCRDGEFAQRCVLPHLQQHLVLVLGRVSYACPASAAGTPPHAAPMSWSRHHPSAELRVASVRASFDGMWDSLLLRSQHGLRCDNHQSPEDWLVVTRDGAAAWAVRAASFQLVLRPLQELLWWASAWMYLVRTFSATSATSELPPQDGAIQAPSSVLQAVCTSLPALDVTLQPFDIVVPLEPIAVSSATPECDRVTDAPVRETSLLLSCAHTLPHGGSARRDLEWVGDACLVLSVPTTHLVIHGGGTAAKDRAREHRYQGEAGTLVRLCLGTAGEMLRLSCQRIATDMGKEMERGGETARERCEGRALVSVAQLTVDVDGDGMQVVVGPTLELIVDALVLRLVGDGLLYSTRVPDEYYAPAQAVLKRLLASGGDWRMTAADALVLEQEETVTLPDARTARALVTLLQCYERRGVATSVYRTEACKTAPDRVVSSSPLSLTLRVSFGLVRLLVRAEDGGDMMELECMQPDTPPQMQDRAATCVTTSHAVVLHYVTDLALRQQRTTTLLIADVAVTTPTGKSLGTLADLRLVQDSRAGVDGSTMNTTTTVYARSVSLVVAPELVQVLELIVPLLQRTLLPPPLPPAVDLPVSLTSATGQTTSLLHSLSMQIASITVTLPLHSVPDWPLQALTLSLCDIDVVISRGEPVTDSGNKCCVRVDGGVAQAMRVEEDACDGELRYFALLGPRVMQGTQAAMRLALSYDEESAGTRQCGVRLSGGYICLYVPFLLQFLDAVLHDALYIALLRLSSSHMQDGGGGNNCSEDVKEEGDSCRRDELPDTAVTVDDRAKVHLTASLDDVAVLLATDAHAPVDAEDRRGYVYLHVQHVYLRKVQSADGTAGHESSGAVTTHASRILVDVGEVLYMASPHSPLRPLFAGLTITLGVGQQLLPDLTGDMSTSSGAASTWHWAIAAGAQDVAVLVQVIAPPPATNSRESQPALHLSLSPSHLILVVRAIVHNVLAPPPPHWCHARAASVSPPVAVYVVVPTVSVALLAHDADGPVMFALTLRHGLRYFHAAGGALGAGAMDKLVLGAISLVRHDGAGDGHVADSANVTPGGRCVLVEVAQAVRVDMVQSAGSACGTKAPSSTQCRREVHAELHQATLWLSATEAWLALCETLLRPVLTAALPPPSYHATCVYACDSQSDGVCRSISCTECAQATGGATTKGEVCGSQLASRGAQGAATAVSLDVHVQFSHCCVVVASVGAPRACNEGTGEEGAVNVLLRLPHLRLTLQQELQPPWVTRGGLEEIARDCQQGWPSTRFVVSLTAMQSPALLLATALSAGHASASLAGSHGDVSSPDVMPLVRWATTTPETTPLAVTLERQSGVTVSDGAAPGGTTEAVRVTVRSAHLRVYVPLLHCRLLTCKLHTMTAEWQQIMQCLMLPARDGGSKAIGIRSPILSLHVTAVDSVIEGPATLVTGTADLSAPGHPCCALLLRSLAVDLTSEKDGEERHCRHGSTAVEAATSEEDDDAAAANLSACAVWELLVTCSGAQLHWPAIEPLTLPKFIVQYCQPCACDATQDYLVTTGEEVVVVALAPAHVRALMQFVDVVQYAVAESADVCRVTCVATNGDCVRSTALDAAPNVRLRLCVHRLRLLLYDGATAQGTGDDKGSTRDAVQRLGALLFTMYTSEELRVVLAQSRGVTTLQVVMNGTLAVIDAEDCLVLRCTHDGDDDDDDEGGVELLTLSLTLARAICDAHVLQLRWCDLQLHLGEPLIALVIRLLHCRRTVVRTELEHYTTWRARHGTASSQPAPLSDTPRASRKEATAPRLGLIIGIAIHNLALSTDSGARLELREVQTRCDTGSEHTWRAEVEVAETCLARTAASTDVMPTLRYVWVRDMHIALQANTQGYGNHTSRSDDNSSNASNQSSSLSVTVTVRDVQVDCWDGKFPAALLRTLLALQTRLTSYYALLATSSRGGSVAVLQRTHEASSPNVSCNVTLEQAQLRLHLDADSATPDEPRMSCVVWTTSAVVLRSSGAGPRYGAWTLQTDAIRAYYAASPVMNHKSVLFLQPPCDALRTLPLVAPFSCLVQTTAAEHGCETMVQVSALVCYVPLHATLLERCAAGLTRLVLPCLTLTSGYTGLTNSEQQQQAAVSAHWSSTVAALRAPPQPTFDNGVRHAACEAEGQAVSYDAPPIILHIDNPATDPHVARRRRRRVALQLTLVELHGCDGGVWQDATSAAPSVSLSDLQRNIRCGVRLHKICIEKDTSSGISRSTVTELRHCGHHSLSHTDGSSSAYHLHVDAVTSVVDQNLQHGFLSATAPTGTRAMPAIAIEYARQPLRASSSSAQGAAPGRHRRLTARLHSVCLVLSAPLLRLLNAQLLLPIARGVQTARVTHYAECRAAKPAGALPPQSISTSATQQVNSSVHTRVMHGVTVWSSEEDIYLHGPVALGGPGGSRLCFRATPHGSNVRTMCGGMHADGMGATAAILTLAMCVDTTGARVTPIVVESGLTVCLRDMSVAFRDVPREDVVADDDAATAIPAGTLSPRVVEALLARYVTLGERAVLLVERVAATLPVAAMTTHAASDAPAQPSDVVVVATEGCRDLVELDATVDVAVQLQSRQRRFVSLGASGTLHYQREVITRATAATGATHASMMDEQGEVALRDIAVISDTGPLLTGLTTLTLPLHYAPRAHNNASEGDVTDVSRVGGTTIVRTVVPPLRLCCSTAQLWLLAGVVCALRESARHMASCALSADETAAPRSTAACEGVVLFELGVTAPHVEFVLVTRHMSGAGCVVDDHDDGDDRLIALRVEGVAVQLRATRPGTLLGMTATAAVRLIDYPDRAAATTTRASPARTLLELSPELVVVAASSDAKASASQRTLTYRLTCPQLTVTAPLLTLSRLRRQARRWWQHLSSGDGKEEEDEEEMTNYAMRNNLGVPLLLCAETPRHGGGCGCSRVPCGATVRIPLTCGGAGVEGGGRSTLRMTLLRVACFPTPHNVPLAASAGGGNDASQSTSTMTMAAGVTVKLERLLRLQQDDTAEVTHRVPMSGAESGFGGISACGLYDVMLRRAAASRVIDATSVVRVCNDLPNHRLFIGAMCGDMDACGIEDSLSPMTSRYATLTELRQPFGFSVQEMSDTGSAMGMTFSSVDAIDDTLSHGTTRLLTLAMIVEAFCLVDHVRDEYGAGEKDDGRRVTRDVHTWSGVALLDDDDGGSTLRLPLVLSAASASNSRATLAQKPCQLIVHLQLRKRSVAAPETESSGDTVALLVPLYEVELHVQPVLTLLNATRSKIDVQLLAQSCARTTSHTPSELMTKKSDATAAAELVAALSAMHPCTTVQDLPDGARLAWLPRSVSEYHSRPHLRLKLYVTGSEKDPRRGVFVPAHAEPVDLTAVESSSVIDMVETDGTTWHGRSGGGTGAQLGLLCERVGGMTTWRLRAVAEVQNETPLPMHLFDAHHNGAVLVGFAGADAVDAESGSEGTGGCEASVTAGGQCDTRQPRHPLFLPPFATGAPSSKSGQWAVRVALGGRGALPSAPFLPAPGLPAIGFASIEAPCVHLARVACLATPSSVCRAEAEVSLPVLTVRPMWHMYNAHPTLALRVFCCCGGDSVQKEEEPEAMAGEAAAAVIMRIPALRRAALCKFYSSHAESQTEPLVRVRYDAVGFHWSPPLKLTVLAAASGSCLLLRHHWHGDEGAAAELHQLQHVSLYEVRAVPTRYGDEPVKERFACLALRPTSRLRDGECDIHVTLRDTPPIVVENRTPYTVQCDQVGGTSSEVCVAEGDPIVGRPPWWGCLLAPFTDTALCYDTAAFAPPSLRLTLLLPPPTTDPKVTPHVRHSSSVTCTVSLQTAMSAPERHDVAHPDRRTAHTVATVLVRHDVTRDCCFVSVLQEAGALVRSDPLLPSLQQAHVQTCLQVFVRELRLFIAASGGVMPLDERSKCGAPGDAPSSSVPLQISEAGEADLVCVHVTSLSATLALTEREVASRVQCAGLTVIDCTSPRPVFPVVLRLGGAGGRASESDFVVHEERDAPPAQGKGEVNGAPICFAITVGVLRHCAPAADGAAATCTSPVLWPRGVTAVVPVCLNEVSLAVAPVSVQLHDNFLFALRAALTPLLFPHRQPSPLQQRSATHDTAPINTAPVDDAVRATSQPALIDCSIATLHLSSLVVELTVRRRGDGQCDPFRGLCPGGLFTIPSVNRAALRLSELHRSSLRQRGPSLTAILTALLWPAYRTQLLRLLLQLVGSCENLGTPLTLLAGWSRGVSSLLQEGVIERRPLRGLRSFLRETTTSTQQSLHALARSNARLYRRGEPTQPTEEAEAKDAADGCPGELPVAPGTGEVASQMEQVLAVRECAYDHDAYMRSGRNFPRVTRSDLSSTRATTRDARNAEAKRTKLQEADTAQRCMRFVTARHYDRVVRDVHATLNSDDTAADEAHRIVAQLGEHNYALHAPYEDVAHFSTAEGFCRYVEVALAGTLASRLRRVLRSAPSCRHSATADLVVTQGDASVTGGRTQDGATAVARERRLRVRQAHELRASLGLVALRQHIGLEAFLAVCTLDEIRASFAAEDFQSACALPMLATLTDALHILMTLTT